eukprot:CFRG4922T1
MSVIYTPEEVAAHNTEEDIWFVVHGKVYDVTPFMDEHPGGEEVLLELAGADASVAFDDVGHSTDAVNMLDEYYKGDLKGEIIVKKTEKKSVAGSNVKPESSSINYLIPLSLVIAAILYKVYFS